MNTTCYDFPEVVIHDPSGECGRYQDGGVCHPVPRPNPAVTEREIRAVQAYQDFRRYMAGDKSAMGEVKRVKAKGVALDPVTKKVIDSQNPQNVIPFPIGQADDD